MKWQYESIGDVCLVGDGAHTKIQRQNEGVLYLTCKNFKQGMIDLSKVDYISEEDYTKYFRENSKALTKPEVGDILFSIIGTLGEPYLYKEQDRFGISSSVSILRPNLSKIHPHYLYYWIESHKFQKALYGIKGGVAQSYVSLEMIRALPINYPDVKTQQKIADLLSKYDDLIENNRRRIELLEQSARSLYREWFIYLRFPGHEHIPIIDGIPEGWEKKTLAELSDSINYGYTARSSLESIGTKYLRITDIVPSIIDWEAVPFCIISENDLQKFCLREGDILVARTGATVGYAKRIGKLTYNSVFASYLVRFRFNNQLNNVIAGVFMESENYKIFVRNNAGGAAQPNANAKILSSASILVPPKLIQNNFSEIVEAINYQKAILQEQNQKLKQARDLLLPRLMNGEIAV